MQKHIGLPMPWDNLFVIVAKSSLANCCWLGPPSLLIKVSAPDLDELPIDSAIFEKAKKWLHSIYFFGRVNWSNQEDPIWSVFVLHDFQVDPFLLHDFMLVYTGFIQFRYVSWNKSYRGNIFNFTAFTSVAFISGYRNTTGRIQRNTLYTLSA